MNLCAKDMKYCGLWRNPRGRLKGKIPGPFRNGRSVRLKNKGPKKEMLYVNNANLNVVKSLKRLRNHVVGHRSREEQWEMLLGGWLGSSLRAPILA